MEKKSHSLRESNIELLRIVAMFLVLTVHADFLSLGTPTQSELQIAPVASCTRFFIESLSIVCVNVFVLISGWFGIKASTKSFLRFIFQCFFFLIGIYAANILLGHNTLSLRGIFKCTFYVNWFITAYICLYILAPALNAFVRIADKSQLQLFLLVFFTFQTLYGWIGGQLFSNGYSTLSFIGLYILGRYLNLYSRLRATPPRLNWLAYLFFSVPTTVCAIVLQHTSLGRLAYSYASPFVIIAATALLLAFANTRIPNNRCINWVAASSFAIFLLHIDPHIFTSKFKYTVTSIYASTDGILCLLYIGCFLLLVALAAILIDQIRIMLWNLLSQFIERMGEKHEAIRRIWNYKSSL